MEAIINNVKISDDEVHIEYSEETTAGLNTYTLRCKQRGLRPAREGVLHKLQTQARGYINGNRAQLALFANQSEKRSHSKSLKRGDLTGGPLPTN